MIEFDYTTSEPWTGGLKFPTLDHAFKYIDELETQKEVRDYLESYLMAKNEMPLPLVEVLCAD